MRTSDTRKLLATVAFPLEMWHQLIPDTIELQHYSRDIAVAYAHCLEVHGAARCWVGFDRRRMCDLFSRTGGTMVFVHRI